VVLNRLVLAFFHEVHDAVHVEGSDGFLAGIGFLVSHGDPAFHESVFGEDGGAVGVLQDVENELEVRIAVCVIGSDVMAGEVLTGLLVQTVNNIDMCGHALRSVLLLQESANGTKMNRKSLIPLPLKFRSKVRFLPSPSSRARQVPFRAP